LQALNPGKSFDRAGETIVVVHIQNEPAKEKVARIEIDKPRKTLKGTSTYAEFGVLGVA
jgi:hypothetical protein